MPPAAPRRFRRRLLLAGGGGVLLAGGSLAAWRLRDEATEPPPPASASSPGPGLPRLAAFAPDAGVRAEFASTEQVLGSYAATLPALTAAISTAPGSHGWFGGGFWRTPVVPSNARSQENVVTLAWFYSQPRSWNPWSGSADLRVLLAAGLTYYLSLQRPDGSMAERPDISPRVATDFGLVFLAHTQRLLVGQPFDEALRSRLGAAILALADWFLDPDNTDVWEGGVLFSNQVTAGLLGCWLVHDQLGAQRQQRLATQTDVYLDRVLSPAGYLYENYSVDFGYTSSVTFADLGQLIALSGDARLLRLSDATLDFFGYHYLWEPDGAGFVINGGIGARRSVTALEAARTDQNTYTDLIALLRHGGTPTEAYLTPAEDRDAQRLAWRDDPAPIPALGPGRVDPTRIAQLGVAYRLPSVAERLAAVDRLPPRARDRFVERRDDRKYDQHHAFVRRPTYYCTAFWGRRAGHQRMGLGVLHHPATGTFLTTQPTPGPWWGGSTDAGSEPLAELTGTFADGAALELRLRSATAGTRRRVRFGEDAVAVELAGPAPLREQLPLLLRADDELSWIDGGSVAPGATTSSARARGLRVVRAGGTFVLESPVPLDLVLDPPSGTLFPDASRSVRALQLTARGSLSYTVRIEL